MGYTVATMRNSTKEQRKSRKDDIWRRMRREIRKKLPEQEAESLIRRLKSDIDELIEIGHVEGYQCGRNDTLNKGINK